MLFPNDLDQFNQLLARVGPPAPNRPLWELVGERQASEQGLDEVLKIAAHQERQAANVADLRAGLTQVLGARLESERDGQVKTFRQLSEASKQQYARDTARFRKWCAEADVSWLPAAPESVAAFLLETCVADVPTPAMAARLSTAIKLWHLLKGEADPTSDPFVRAVRRWIKGVNQEPETVAADSPSTEH
jgi:hypothetical protein